MFRQSSSSMKLNLCGVILVLCFVEALGWLPGMGKRQPTAAQFFRRKASGPASVENDLGSSGETWEVSTGDGASGLVTAGPSGEETGEVNEDPSVENSVELFPKPTGAPSSVQDSVELFPKPTGALSSVQDSVELFPKPIGALSSVQDSVAPFPQPIGAPIVPVQRFFYQQKNSVTRREDGITSGSGSDENGSGSEESYTCADPPFYKLLSLFRGFPKTESKEMYGYEAALYDPLLDEFWARKNDQGLDKALGFFMKEFSQAIMAEKYQCKGTQLNQMLIDVLKDTTTKFMSEAKTYIQDAVGKMKKPVSRGTYTAVRPPTYERPGLYNRAAPPTYERPGLYNRDAPPKYQRSRLSNRAGVKPGPGQGPSKGGKDMMDPKSKKEQFVAKILALLKKVLREDSASHMETEQFGGVACYLRDVMEYLRGEVEANVPLEQIKVDLATWSMADYGFLFECMDPLFIVMIYEDNWQNVNLPYEENILFQHIGESLKNILQREGKGDKDRQSIDKVLNIDFPLNLTEVIHKFAMKVFGELQPFLDAKSADQMVDFFRKFLTPEKMKFAEKLIRSLDIFFEGTTSLPDPMTSSAEPVYRRSNWMESEYEIENEMNRLSKKWSRDGLSKKWSRDGLSKKWSRDGLSKKWSRDGLGKK
ncbi:uncharacterized protein LOC134695432 isoform X2 [Mytilus trossulus]|uniref:uncharacterized protein LOC134695432 isoform X2 n=1 Tax=Mytilus trossulus TaxID=6551 RepID=UPI00300668CE